MDPLDFLEPEELLRFFHCHKTEMSCMENPRIFLCQLRDHDLIPEDKYKKVSRMKSKDNMKNGLYEVLDSLEKEQPQDIKVFWGCVFKETIMNQYPTLRMMRNSLMDGSFHFDSRLPRRTEKDKTNEGKSKELSEDEEGEKQANSAKKKRKQRRVSACDDEEEQPGPSSKLTAGQKKKSKKICFSSPLKKGEKGEVWTWAIYRFQLPVTCGDQKGMLNRSRLSKGEKCIAVEKQWFTPAEFERFAGKEGSKNWKLTIRCMGTPLGTLLREGHLKSAGYRGSEKAKKSLFPSDNSVTVSDGEEDEEDEDEDCDLDKVDQVSVSASSKESSSEGTEEEGEVEEETELQPEAGHDSGEKVFKVTCGAIAGTLHKKRFASGTLGKSIRTETSWMTPMEFMMEASSGTDASWKKDIKWEGKPLIVLIEAKVLKIHSLLCSCRLCKPNCKDLEDQKNDDECFICKSEEEEEDVGLVVCDDCPRSFHQTCHLPHVDSTILGDGRLWMCTFCVFRRNQEYYYWNELEWEAAMSCQISQHMLGCQYLFLSLCSADQEQAFATNPSLYLKNYSTVVETPMWLCKVADKLENQLYQTVGEFVSDVHLIFTNCAAYNKENAEFLEKSNRLKKLFDREFKTVFNIREQTADS